ncbi:hypothetical protein TNCV_2508681 [Trichonephila clavipes]|nr:hypothetical protein TNCV_2508681 [Trichonephila clavipes]
MWKVGWSCPAIGRRNLQTLLCTSDDNNVCCLGHSRMPDSVTPKYRRSGLTTGEYLAQNVSQNDIRNLYHSLPRHIQACITVKGGSTNY